MHGAAAAAAQPPDRPGLLLAGVLGGACSRAAPELILPVSNWPGYEYFYLAELNDLAAAEGLRLRTAEFPDPQAIVHAFLRGELQLAQLTTVEAVDICSLAPDRCPVMVLVLDESRGGDQVAARPGIGSLAELRGRREGLTPAEFSAAEQGLVYWPLRQQEAMLAPGGTLERNLEAVQAVQSALKLVTPDSALPRVSQVPVRAALR
jgi:hypothetical protein